MEKQPQDALPMIEKLYGSFAARHAEFRKRLGRALTLTEKILFAHWVDSGRLPERGKSNEYFHPDRVAMQDATAQMAILQFISAGMPETAVPTTVHCDHLILAKTGAGPDMKTALDVNREVYDFLASAARKFGMGFWKPGSGIIHQVLLENYVFPGGLMIGTDSHTVNGGGLGMLAIGVGGADAVDVMVGFPWELLWPKLVGVRLTGKPSGWTSGKDVILKLAGVLTVKGGTNKIIEYFGPGCAELSCTAKGTITNMGAELGATTSVFPYDKRMADYLRATGRAAWAELADKHAAELVADPETARNPKSFYDEIVEIDLSTLQPHIVGPHTPDLAREVSQLPADVKKNGWPEKLTATLIGSCTNSSYEDITRAADIARQAKKAGLKAKMPFMVTPGSEQVRATIERDGLLADLEAAGATVLANACGPCIGQWERTDGLKGKPNSILTSYNRNFPARNDGAAETAAFIGSPEVVTAYAFSGTLAEDPIHDGVALPDGKRFQFTAPRGVELPPKGFTAGVNGYVAPVEDGSQVSVSVDPKSDRLALLEPFEPRDYAKYKDMPVLLKAAGKCTTDHISPAGPWLKYRGHLDNISNNMFGGANNAFAKQAGHGVNVFTGETAKLCDIARDYKKRGITWVAVGDQNYGEGSSREHAAMSPRHLGCGAVITRSFARIHQTNLKKQGIVPLTFVDPKDYEKIQERDRVELTGIETLAPGRNLVLKITHADGKTDQAELAHTMNDEQIKWFKGGSALNLIRQQQKRK